jgi:hypothetical protein
VCDGKEVNGDAVAIYMPMVYFRIHTPHISLATPSFEAYGCFARLDLEYEVQR